MTLRPLTQFIVDPVRDDLVSPDVAYLMRLYEKVLVPEVSHRDPDGAIALLPQFERGPLAGWVIHLPWEKNPLPMNRNGRRGGGWRAEATQKAMVREVAFQMARRRIPPQDRIRVGLEWEVVDARTRDEDNLVLLMKHLTDGVRLAGVVPDDDRRYVSRLMPEIHYAPKGPRRPKAHFLFRIEVPND